MMIRQYLIAYANVKARIAIQKQPFPANLSGHERPENDQDE